MGATDLLEDLLAEQRRRWQAGEPAQVEEYLGRHPALAGDPEAVLDLIYNEVLLRERHGAPPRLEEYLARFPHLAEQVRVQFEVHSAFPVEDDEGAPLWDTRAVGSGGPPGDRAGVGGYEILRELGRGSMGVVYEARQLALKRRVALKWMRGYGAAAPEVRARFLTEAEAVARLQHPNIVQVYEVGEHDGEPFLSLELVGGGNLAQKLGGAPQPPRAAAELVQTLARAMAHAHQAGIVHRDLKPANVLLTADGQPKITDFGLAKLLDSDAGQTHSEAFLGTPSYMAPEQARGEAREVGPAADVYALGAILYEALTGRPPFRGTTVLETAEQVRSQEPVPPRRLQPGVPRDLETVCHKCLEKEPRKRYATALDLADDLRRFLAGEPVVARPTTAWRRAGKWARRRPAAAALIAVSLLAALGVGGLALRQRQLWADRARLDAQERYQRFIRGRDTALFSKIYGQGLDPGRSLGEMQAAGDDALAAVTGADGALALSPYWTEVERAEARSGSYELLLVMADAFLKPAPGTGAAPQPEQALRYLDRAAGLGPASRAYHDRRGRCLALLGRKDEAAREGDLARSVAEVTAADSFLEGDDCFQRHDLAGAVRAFGRALAQQPDHFWAQYYLAFCDLEEQRYGEARARLTALLGRRPDFAWTRLLRGLANTQLHAADAADADFAEAARSRPDGEALYALHVHRGILNVERKRFAEAGADLRQAVALQPGRHQAYKGLALLARQEKRDADALRRLDQALALAPPPARAEIHALRGDALERLGRHADAVRACDAALALRPDRADAQFLRGQALLEEQHYAEAVQAFTRCLDGGGASREVTPKVYWERGLAYSRLGNYPAALSDYTWSLAAEPNADLYDRRGWTYFFADAWKPALADFEEALRRDPGHEEARVGRGLCRALLGHYREAAADAEEAWQHRTKNAELVYNLSCVFAQAAGRARADRAAPDGPALAAHCRARAVEALRAALALKPAGQRLPFWKNPVLTDTALDPIRDSAEFKRLAAQVEAGQLP